MSVLRERLNKVLNRLEEMENSPSELTKDALLVDLRGLYDSVKETSVSGIKKTVSVEQTAEEQKNIEPVSNVQETELDKTEIQQASVPEPVVMEDRQFSHPQDEMKEEKPFIPDPPVFEEVEDVEKSFAEQRQSLIGTIEESEKASDEKILAGQLGNKPLEDLRTGIPLNEKFGIIRGLFNGNASDFGDAVLKLNNAANPHEMGHYLELLEKRFQWDSESEPYLTFLTYIERKMMTLQVSNANADK